MALFSTNVKPMLGLGAAIGATALWMGHQVGKTGSGQAFYQSRFGVNHPLRTAVFGTFAPPDPYQPLRMSDTMPDDGSFWHNYQEIIGPGQYKGVVPVQGKIDTSTGAYAPLPTEPTWDTTNILQGIGGRPNRGGLSPSGALVLGMYNKRLGS